MSLRLTREDETGIPLLRKEGARGWLTCVLVSAPPPPNPLLKRGGELSP
jgi:hypothetical protein